MNTPNRTTHGASVHHDAAASHHRQAAHHHEEAGRHYQWGKDYAHAAHQALIAHGHSGRALYLGNAAWSHYDTQDSGAPEKPVDRERRHAVRAGPPDMPSLAGLSAADHHAAAADHHHKAAEHHSQAMDHANLGLFQDAIQEATLAEEHARRSLFHGHEAAMYHVEHHGKSAPTAEIA